MSSILLQYSKSESFLKKNFSKKLHTQKNRLSGAPGLVRASPWRAKISQCRKTERGGPLRFFNIHSVAKPEKIEKKTKFSFSRKNLTMPKKTERGTLWDFLTSILSQNIKKMQGGPFGEKFCFEKTSRSAEKKERGEPSVSSVRYVTRKNSKNLFGSVR